MPNSAHAIMAEISLAFPSRIGVLLGIVSSHKVLLFGVLSEPRFLCEFK